MAAAAASKVYVGVTPGRPLEALVTFLRERGEDEMWKRLPGFPGLWAVLLPEETVLSGLYKRYLRAVGVRRCRSQTELRVFHETMEFGGVLRLKLVIGGKAYVLLFSPILQPEFSPEEVRSKAVFLPRRGIAKQCGLNRDRLDKYVKLWSGLHSTPLALKLLASELGSTRVRLCSGRLLRLCGVRLDFGGEGCFSPAIHLGKYMLYPSPLSPLLPALAVGVLVPVVVA